jgi:hypothetical protein
METSVSYYNPRLRFIAALPDIAQRESSVRTTEKEWRLCMQQVFNIGLMD